MNNWEATLGFFVFVCAIVALACSLIRDPDWRRALREAFHFFLMMLVGIAAFSMIVYLLQWTFVR